MKEMRGLGLDKILGRCRVIELPGSNRKDNSNSNSKSKSKSKDKCGGSSLRSE